MADKGNREKKEGSKGIIKGKDTRQSKLKLEEVKKVKFTQEEQEEKREMEVLNQARLEIRKETENLRKSMGGEV